MTRSIWKGPFVDMQLIKKAEKLAQSGRKEVIKTWSRRSTILPQFVGLTFGVYNGQKFVPVTVSEQMVGHKLGEFSPTRKFSGHTPADKKAAAETGSAPKAASGPGPSSPGASPKASPGAAPAAKPAAPKKDSK